MHKTQIKQIFYHNKYKDRLSLLNFIRTILNFWIYIPYMPPIPSEFLLLLRSKNASGLDDDLAPASIHLNYEIYSIIPKFWGKEGGPSGGQLYVLKWIAKRGWERKGLAGVERSEDESFEWSGSNSSSLHYLSNLLKLLAVKRSSAKREREGGEGDGPFRAD